MHLLVNAWRDDVAHFDNELNKVNDIGSIVARKVKSTYYRKTVDILPLKMKLRMLRDAVKPPLWDEKAGVRGKYNTPFERPVGKLFITDGVASIGEIHQSCSQLGMPQGGEEQGTS